jgi:hypothetical protein
MPNPANGSNNSNRGRFDKKEIPGKLKESPRAKNESSENAEASSGNTELPNPASGPNNSDRGRFDKTEIPSKLKESPREKNESSENAERLHLENSTAC